MVQDKAIVTIADQSSKSYYDLSNGVIFNDLFERAPISRSCHYRHLYSPQIIVTIART